MKIRSGRLPPRPTPVPSQVPSPCISVCRIDPESGYCEGCWRTIPEIAGWGARPDHEKRAVLAEIAVRRRAAGAPAAGSDAGGQQ